MTVSISAIPSRTSGVAPLAVFFDMTGTTSTLTSDPFHDILYYIDYGDSSPGNWSTSGLSKNVDYGPLGAHVYESGGTFTWNVWALDATGGTIVTTSGSITVTAANSQYPTTDTICYRSAATGTFNGAPSGSDNRTSSSWSTIIGALASGKRVLLRNGDTWNAGSTNATLPSSGPWTLGAFGTDSSVKPIVNGTGAGGNLTVPAATVDGRIMDIDFRGDSTEHGAAIFGGFGAITKLLLFRLSASAIYNLYNHSYDSAANTTECFMVDCTLTNIGTGGAGGSGYGAYMGGIKCAILGMDHSSFNGTDGHPIRLWHGRKFKIGHTNIVDGPVNKDCIKWHNEIAASPALPDSDLNLISDCYLKGTEECIAYKPQNNTSAEICKNLVIERCRFVGKVETTKFVILDSQKITVRNCIGTCPVVPTINEFHGFVFCQPDGVTCNNIHVYNCTLYVATNPGLLDMVYFRTGTVSGTGIVRNCLMVLNGFSGTSNKPAPTVDAQILFDQAGGNTEDHNVIRTVTTDLVNAATGDYHLVSGASTLIGQGTGVTVFNDYDRAKRPQITTYDVGAFERLNSPADEWSFDPAEGGETPSLPVPRNVIYCA